MPIGETIRGFKEILDGQHDDVPESAFLLKGTIDDVVEAREEGLAPWPHETFTVEVLTPEGEVFNDEVEQVSTRTGVGSIGILARHQPLLGLLEPTELRLYKSDSRRRALRPGRGLRPGLGRRRPAPRRGGHAAGRARHAASCRRSSAAPRRSSSRPRRTPRPQRRAARDKKRWEAFLRVARGDEPGQRSAVVPASRPAGRRSGRDGRPALRGRAGRAGRASTASGAGSACNQALAALNGFAPDELHRPRAVSEVHGRLGQEVEDAHPRACSRPGRPER